MYITFLQLSNNKEQESIIQFIRLHNKYVCNNIDLNEIEYNYHDHKVPSSEYRSIIGMITYKTSNENDIIKNVPTNDEILQFIINSINNYIK